MEGLHSHQGNTQSLWKEKKQLWVDNWWGNRKQVSAFHTLCSQVLIVITGVTLGFCHQMRSVCTRFPINAVVQENGSLIEIRNFLAEKYIHRFQMRSVIDYSLHSPER